MKDKKIRLIVTALVPKSSSYIGKTGGLVRLVEILKRSGDPNKMKIILISSDDKYADYFNENDIDTEFKLMKSNLKFKSLPGLCVKSLLILIKSFFVLNLDFLESQDEKVVVYSSSDLFWEVIPAFYFKIKNKNIEWVQVIHHVYPDWRKRPGKKMENFFGYYAQRFSFWLIRKKSDKLILVNSLVKSHLIKKGFPEKKIFISSNGINLEHFEQIKRSETSYEGVFLGRLNYSKGLTDLVKIWKNVCQEFPGAKLAVVGGGSKETTISLSKKIMEHKLEKSIDLLGFLEDKEAHSILKSAKVFIFPSHEEGWGIAIAEAMACGLPVVSWDLPNFKSVFENRTLRVRENDFDLFAEEIRKFLRDEDSRKKFGDKGREFIQRYSWEKVAEKEYEIISQQQIEKMPNKIIRKNIFTHPASLRMAKFFLSHRLVANNSIYKKLVMQKAKKEALRKIEYKETICIETALTCNSRCIFCGHHDQIMSGIMPMDLFRKIIDECRDYGIHHATLGVYGEIFTDKSCIEKIKYLRASGMTYAIITNASLLHRELTDQLFELGGLTYINFSVNGFSREVYEKTMVGLKRDITYKNILYFLEQKKKLRANDPIVTITAVETKLNKKDYKDFFRFWKKQEGVSDVLSAELMDRMGAEYDGKIGKLGQMNKKNNWLSPCRMLWGPLNVYYDGKVGACCKDNDKRELIIGDLTKQTLKEISTGTALCNLRECHLAGNRKKHPVCGKCFLNSIWLR